MKKKVLLTVIALGVFFISSCEGVQDTLNDSPHSLGFVQETLRADTAAAGVTAGSFSAEGGNGILSYSLVSGEGDEDNGFFAVEGTVLKIKESLAEYDGYSFRVKVEDGKGEYEEGKFTLTVGPPDEQGNSGDPDDPGNPTVPGVPGEGGSKEGGGDENTGEGENSDAPNIPDVPGGSGNTGGGSEEDGEGGDTGGGGNSGGTVSKPARATGLKSTPGMQYVKLSWNAAARAAGYEVHYSAADDFAAAIKYDEEPTETALTVRGLADATAYNFWVVAKNAGGSATQSNPHKADRTGDILPEYLQYGLDLTEPGKAVTYSAHNFWPRGDYYLIQELGEDYPADERYPFSYGAGDAGGPGGDLYPGGVIKFIRTFEPPSCITAAGPNADIAGVIIYEFTYSGGKQNGNKGYQPTYFWSPHLPPTSLPGANGMSSHAPAAVMGNARASLAKDSLEDAIALFAHPGNGIKGSGSGGMTDCIVDMTIFYCYNPNWP
jgi:hypothetical protein